MFDIIGTTSSEFFVKLSGEKLRKLLALFPTIYLSTGTCLAPTIMGRESMKIFFETAYSTQCNADLLTTTYGVVPGIWMLPPSGSSPQLEFHRRSFFCQSVLDSVLLYTDMGSAR